MKKILITLLMILSLGTGAQAGKPRQNTQLRTLVASYRGTEGFEVADFGGAETVRPWKCSEDSSASP